MVREMIFHIPRTSLRYQSISMPKSVTLLYSADSYLCRWWAHRVVALSNILRLCLTGPHGLGLKATLRELPSQVWLQEGPCFP